MKYFLIRPLQRMASTATERALGIAVFIGDSETDKRGNTWLYPNLVKLPHIPYDGKKAFHSPDGFQLGYNGSGPSDLSIAICHFLGKPKLWLAFREHVIAKLNREKALDMPFDSIKLVLGKIERGEPI